MGNNMRAARFLAILILLAAIVAAVLYLFRLPLAGVAVRSAMAGAGLENPQARVSVLTLERIRLENLSVGPDYAPAISFDSIEAGYNWRDLMLSREVDAVQAGPGVLRLAVDKDGTVSIPGMETGGGGAGGGALPFSSLSLKQVTLLVDAPEGGAQGEISAEYDVDGGGAGDAMLTTQSLSWKGVRISSARADTTFDLSADGQVRFAASFNGDVEARGLRAHDASFRIDGQGASWRDIVNGVFDRAAGKARIAFNAPEILFANETPPDALRLAPVEAALGDEISEAALAGAFDAVLAADGLEVRLAPDAPLTLAAPDGAGFSLAGSGGAPIYARKGGRETTSFLFELKSDGVNASGAVDAERQGDSLRVAAPVRIEEYTSPDFAIAGSTIDFAAIVEGDDLAADLAVSSGVRKAQIGRLAVTDAPFSSAFTVEANLAAKTANIYNKEECIALEQGHARLAEQNAEATLGRTRICNKEGPLAVLTWTGDMVCSLSGEISSESGRFRMGETHASGRPPDIRFNAVYNPLENRTDIEGDVSNGAMTLNDAINLSAVLGRFDFSLDDETMRADGEVERVRVAQSGETQLAAPVIASGRVTLEGDKTTFDYALATTAGRALGTGTGAHDMAAASGETEFSFDGLQFAPDGLQPNELALGLKGIVSAAQGGVDGSIRFGWSPAGVTSGADVHLNNISFSGPTLAVTRTIGVNGDMAFSDLLPVATEGVQTITINTVDAGALQLRNGDVSFEFPGDDTLHLSRAEFPWFGGTLGAYDATASFTGEARIPLRAENVDLKQVFDFVEIDGLSGEGVLSGSLPLIFEAGKARIENGVLRSKGPGAIRYTGAAAQAAAAAGENAQIAFDFLRDLRYKSLEVTVNGALDGQLEFSLRFEGAGDVTVRNQNVKNVPVLYRINLTVENMDLIRQANLLRTIQLEVQEELSGRSEQ